ncbi:MAG: A/G-specific adenine glycosylase, partial [Xenococcaceae cyanobacterium]
SRWNLTLLDFGALVCTARNPNCDRCPLAKQCHYLNRS